MNQFYVKLVRAEVDIEVTRTNDTVRTINFAFGVHLFLVIFGNSKLHDLDKFNGIRLTLYLGCCKLENEILKEARHLEK